MLEISLDYRGVMEALNELPVRLRREMLDEAVKAGGRVIRKAALARVPKGKTGNLRKSLKVRTLRSKNPMLSMYEVVFSQRGNDKGYHAHLIEYGHRVWRRKNRGRGSVAATGKKYEMEPTSKHTVARPMLRPAFFTQKGAALEAVRKKLSVEEMEKRILKKLRSRARVRARNVR